MHEKNRNPDIYARYGEAVQSDIEKGAFHSELDRLIASSVVDTLQTTAGERQAAPEAYEEVLDSAHALIPKTGEDGFRYIAGSRVTKQHEVRIRSRLASPEIDMADKKTGTWGSLPEPVKFQLTQYGAQLSIEPTSHCTVGCSFCTLANHGPIAAKASFESILDVISYFAYYQGQDGLPNDLLYNGSDPFDLKWQKPGQRERDYTDLGEAYRHIAANGSRALWTSTAVPLGEEWRVLRYLVDMFDRDDTEGFRFSVTNTNYNRVNHILNVLEFLDEQQTAQLTANNHAAAPELITYRGQSFVKQEHLRLYDIIGPESSDGVVIGATAIRGVILRGATRSHPYGSEQLRLGVPLEDGSRRYSVPRYYRSPARSNEPINGPFYPPAIIDHLTVRDDGRVDRETEVREHDPYRALLRVAAGYLRLLRASDFKVTLDMKVRFAELFTDSVKEMEQHINRQPDEIMSLVIDLINEEFFQNQDEAGVPAGALDK